MAATWSFGDRVTHADRPEWGVGQITAVQPIIVEGRPSQRLTIRFERAGVKTIAAAVANIRKADDKALDKAPAAQPNPAPQAETQGLSDAELTKRLAGLPEDVVDPFIPLPQRLEKALALYRFSDRGGSILDWAAMQTGLADPLTRFLRHDLEIQFAAFKRALDRHVGELGAQLQRQDRALLQTVVSGAPEAGQQALRRALARR